MKRLITCITILLMATPAWAGIQSDMNNFFNSMGINSNFTGPGRYNSQSGGYITGGAMFTRAPIRNYQLVSYTPGHISAGCGGIDAYLGGFSFINQKQFTAMLRNIGNNAVGYAFQLALITVSPGIKSVIDNLQNKIQQINKMNFNSCHAAQTLVDGAVGVLTEQSTQGCASIAIRKGLASDMEKAKQRCENEAGFKKFVFYNVPMTKDEKATQTVHKNLMWAGLNSSEYSLMPIKVKELLMSLTGTFINTMRAETPEPYWNAPTGVTVDMLINGTGGAKKMLYSCGVDTGECLPPQNGGMLSLQMVQITGLKTMVRAALDDIRQGLESERATGLSPGFQQNSRRLINMSKLPFLKMMITATALGSSLAMEEENELVEPIAFDIITTYLNWAFTAALNASNNGIKNIPDWEGKMFLDNIRDVIKEFRKEKRSKNMLTASATLQRAKFLDQQLVSTMTPHFQQVFQYARGQ